MIGINIFRLLIYNPLRWEYSILSPGSKYIATVTYYEYSSWKGNTTLTITDANEVSSSQFIFGKVSHEKLAAHALDYYIEQPDQSKTKWISEYEFQYYEQCIHVLE